MTRTHLTCDDLDEWSLFDFAQARLLNTTEAPRHHRHREPATCMRGVRGSIGGGGMEWGRGGGHGMGGGSQVLSECCMCVCGGGGGWGGTCVLPVVVYALCAHVRHACMQVQNERMMPASWLAAAWCVWCVTVHGLCLCGWTAVYVCVWGGGDSCIY